jgi:cysteine synthase A
VVIGADTGHRYTDRVFARHREALDPALLSPIEIDSLELLAPPWSTMDWKGRGHGVPELVPAQERRKDRVP